MIRNLLIWELLFFSFFENFNSEDSKTNCVFDDITYKQGDKFQFYLDCNICTCSNSESSNCTIIENCKDLQCEKNITYETKCCNLLECARIHHMKKDTTEEIIEPTKNNTAIIVTVVILIALITAGVTKYLCSKGHCDTCMENLF